MWGGLMTEKLRDAAEVLFRQIHPDFIQNGEPSSDRFRPSQQDQNKLSLDRSKLVTASQAHANYVAGGRASAAVFGLSVGEFSNENIPCVEDPLPAAGERLANPAHALADYSRHSPSDQKLISKRLKRIAVRRGCLHPRASPAAS
jgi:hypothetical protein